MLKTLGLGAILTVLGCCTAVSQATGNTEDSSQLTSGKRPEIQLELSPRICTLGAHDKQCQTEVHAQWSAPRDESLCLVIVDRPDVKRCWEHYSQGTYSITLTFADDLTFELRDAALQNVLASEVLRVIKEALHYRHRRRDPWNIFE
jgi:hypothetical protein